jgi:lysophospholipase L1-like esterase
MKLSVLVLSGLFLSSSLFVMSAKAQPAAATTAPATQPADEPAPKLGPDGKIQARFETKHESFLKRRTSGPIDVLFLGDSITDNWATKGKEVWDKTYGDMNAANFGIGGDRTQHVLWRIAQGELDGISPKVVVLMIGTNNVMGDWYSADDILKADMKIVQEIHDKIPKTKVLLLAIFPRGSNPDDAKTQFARAKIKAVNEGLAKLDDGSSTRYLDIGDKFLAPDGMITKDIMADALHPTAKGYQIWADAMGPLLGEMMK